MAVFFAGFWGDLCFASAAFMRSITVVSNFFSGGSVLGGSVLGGSVLGGSTVTGDSSSTGLTLLTFS